MNSPFSSSTKRLCSGFGTLFFSLLGLGIIIAIALLVPGNNSTKKVAVYTGGHCSSDCDAFCLEYNNNSNIKTPIPQPLPLPDLSDPTSSPWFISAPISLSKKPVSISDGSFRVDYHKGMYKSISGVDFRANPRHTLPAESAVLSYSVYFPPDFPWQRGGKLPGFCLGDSSDACASGGKWLWNSGSVRVMFREEGHVIAYIYMPLQVSTDGTVDGVWKAQDENFQRVSENKGSNGIDIWCRTDGGLMLQAGIWNTITLAVSMNSNDSADGYLSLTVNNNTRVLKNVNWKSREGGVKVNSLFFSTFFGGGDPSWAVPHETFALFRDFAFTAPINMDHDGA